MVGFRHLNPIGEMVVTVISAHACPTLAAVLVPHPRRPTRLLLNDLYVVHHEQNIANLSLVNSPKERDVNTNRISIPGSETKCIPRLLSLQSVDGVPLNLSPSKQEIAVGTLLSTLVSITFPQVKPLAQTQQVREGFS